MPVHIAVRAAVLFLVSAAFTLTMLAVARGQPLVIVVQQPPPTATFMQPAFCAGYNWRQSSIDLRMWCGWN